MSRVKKDGKFLNCYVKRDIIDKLEIYCDKTLMPKTSVVEKALQQYLAQINFLTINNDDIIA